MKNRLKRYQEGGEVEPTENIPSEAHLRAVAFIDEMLGTMMSSNTALTPVVKLMHRARPAILRDLSQIPAEQLQSFLVDLGTRMIRAGTPENGFPLEGVVLTEYFENPVDDGPNENNTQTA